MLACSCLVLPVCREVGGAEGIVNGMDVTEWNPKTDKLLPVKYDRTTVFEGKAAAKAALQAEMGLPVDPTAPLFGYIGRLEEQKGVDILLAVSRICCYVIVLPCPAGPAVALCCSLKVVGCVVLWGCCAL